MRQICILSDHGSTNETKVAFSTLEAVVSELGWKDLEGNSARLLNVGIGFSNCGSEFKLAGAVYNKIPFAKCTRALIQRNGYGSGGWRGSEGEGIHRNFQSLTVDLSVDLKYELRICRRINVCAFGKLPFLL